MGFFQALKTYCENSRQIVPVWDHSTAPALEIHSPFMASEGHTALDRLQGVASMAAGMSVLVIPAGRWCWACSWLSPRTGKTQCHLGSCN